MEDTTPHQQHNEVSRLAWSAAVQQEAGIHTDVSAPLAFLKLIIVNIIHTNYF